MPRTLTALALFAVVFLTSQSVRAASTSLVIAEVYGGGGNSGATYKNDFVVVFNPTASGVDVNGWSVQYASAALTNWAATPLATSSKIIPAGGYFLVQEAQGAGGTTSLPTPDATGSLAMSGTAGRIALCNDTNVLTNTFSTGPTIVDFVGYGSSAASYEGSGPTPTLSNLTSAQRQNSGCQDTDNNSGDFTTGAPNPRNSSTAVHLCGGALSIDTQPQSRTNNAGTTATFTVNANGAIGFQWHKEGFGDLSNGGNIGGANSSTLSVSNVLRADEGDYSVTVQGSSTSSNSVLAHLTVIDPAIRTQPISHTNVAGDIADMFVTVVGTPPVSFQWYHDNVPVPIGTNTSTPPVNIITPNLTNAQTADAGDYFLVASNSFGSVTSSVAHVTIFPTPSTRIARWNFNFTSVTPSEGSAPPVTFQAIPTVTFPSGSFTDPAEIDAPDFNTALSTAGYPSSLTSNKTAGVQFNVSTVGYKNILLTWEQRHSATASKYLRLQYSPDNFTATTNDYPSPIIMSDTNLAFMFFSTDLSGFPSVNDNTDFAFRIVTEFENSAIGSGTNDYVGTAGSYGTGGTIRYDLMSIYGNLLSQVTPIPLTIQRVGTNVILTWADPAFALQAAPLVTGTYTNVPGAFSPSTNAIDGTQTYFRLIQ